MTARDLDVLLAGLPRLWRSGRDIHVPTHCLYPGGGQVVVIVRPGHDSVLVTDDGLGLTTLLSAGIEPVRVPVQRAGHAAAARLGVTFDGGRLLLDGIEPSEMASAILHVANASQAWVIDVLLATQGACGALWEPWP